MLPTTIQGWRALTGTVLVTIIVLAIAYDVLAKIKGGNDATISICTWDWSKLCPVIPFIVGFICGHIFWRY